MLHQASTLDGSDAIKIVISRAEARAILKPLLYQASTLDIKETLNSFFGKSVCSRHFGKNIPAVRELNNRTPSSSRLQPSIILRSGNI